MHTFTAPFLFFTILIILAPTGVHAFGAGDIPDFSYLNDKAFRHGDIESILESLAKTAGGVASSGGLLGLASSVFSAAKGGEKFGRMDIKRVYFGNWLRDYSQAMDIAGLSKLSAETIVMIVSVLGFMTFGFATEEFEITEERLSVYLPVEHIDNPKGYAEKEGDARQFHPRLRPPVDPRELEIDERTGMKNYMATENQGWDTSTAFIRRTFEACIDHGRRAKGHEGADLWEAYRLLGTGLHTMEDLLAHSNWCELALRKLGHSDVFCHVGDNVVVRTPNGPAPPLVTGTFGSADFIHSLMGEATDHISEASVTNLFEKMNQSGDADTNMEGLKSVLSKLPIGGGSDKADEAEDIKQKAFHFNPDDVAPKEVQEQLLQILRWRDGVYRDIIKKLEMIPGLNELIDQLTNALNAYIYTVLTPWLMPIMQKVTGALDEGSKTVIDSDDQYQVFDDPNASDPSHSMLSKDHFALILNEPAGKIARVVVENTVNLIVQAWFNDEDPRRVIDEILEAFHHPYYATGNSRIQDAMMGELQRWFDGQGEEGQETIQALSKESVREHKNKRLGGADYSGEPGAQPTYSQQPQVESSGYGAHSSGGYGGYQGGSQYSSEASPYANRDDGDPYESRQGHYEAPEDREEYVSQSRRSENTDYYRGDTGYGRPRTDDSYGEHGHDRRYESSSNDDSYSTGRREELGSRGYQEPESEYRREGYQPAYIQPDYGRDGEEYGRRGGGYGRREDFNPPAEESGYGRFGGSYNQQPREEGYGGYGGGHGGGDETFGAERLNLEDRGEEYEGGGYGGGYGGGRRRSPPRGEDYY